ncbi:E3 ubiquitin-protein ligase SIN-like, Zinc finger, RING/FYVE/PHD-type [Artemisia annua]|uniref:E3 ubiquitin-protein ligase SIN-like, Zinc finger, RING/FYVE/PHD-type n=1 Tax=Artemisia annua TaxID=35608 RepID=A0A2U1KYJ0_ARTAN|nr:E3 ubiquitin-protein ligase SIN-like, Zinc finger, RING/FYVE/PHD-type [Artemisia annua]
MVEDPSLNRSSSSHALTFTSPYQCPYDCPNEDCESTFDGGNIPELVTHMEDCHYARMNDRFKFNNLYVHELSNKGNSEAWDPEVFNCYGCYFCLHFQSLTSCDALGDIMFLWFLGEDEEAKKFSYILEISGNGRTLTYKGVPRSIRISSQEICDDLDGMVFSPFFWEENEKERKLRVKGCICLEP